MQSVSGGGLISVDQDRTMTSVTLQGTSVKCHLIHYVLARAQALSLSLSQNNYCTSSFKQTFKFAIQRIVDNIQFAQHPRKQLNLNIYLRRKLKASRFFFF